MTPHNLNSGLVSKFLSECLSQLLDSSESSARFSRSLCRHANVKLRLASEMLRGSGRWTFTIQNHYMIAYVRSLLNLRNVS